MTEGNGHMSHNEPTTRSRKPGAFIQKVGGDNESQVQRIRTQSGIYKRGKLDGKQRGKQTGTSQNKRHKYLTDDSRAQLQHRSLKQ